MTGLPNIFAILSTVSGKNGFRFKAISAISSK
jgi:hypothetical protein